MYSGVAWITPVAGAICRPSMRCIRRHRG